MIAPELLRGGCQFQGLLDYQEVIALFKFLGHDDIPNFIKQVNAQIKPFHLEIKKGICETTDKSYYVLANRANNDITLCASSYTPAELEFFKQLVGKIVADENACVSSINALNLADSLSKRKNELEEVLGRFVEDKWLTKSKGKYYLSVRSIVELDQYLEEHYPDLVKCNICHQMVLRGQSCAECDVKIHVHCARRMMGGQAEKVCPEKGCRAVWPHEIPPKAGSSAQEEPGTSEPDPTTSDNTTTVVESQTSSRKRSQRR